MSIDQIIDYKKRPPKGAEKFFYSATTTVFIVALVSALMMFPFFVALADSADESFIPYDLLDKVSMKQAGGTLVAAILLVLIGFLTETFLAGRRSKVEDRRSYLALVFILLGALSFALSFITIILKSMDRGLNWIDTNEWINSSAQGASSYILWYYVSLGIIFGSSWAVWFILVRHRESKEGVNRLQGGFLKRGWQFFVGDAFSVGSSVDTEGLCVERDLYRGALYLRAIFLCLCPTLLTVVIELGVRMLAV